MGKYYSTKTYGHNIGLSACFRQPNAHSHCKFLHGYSLQFKFTFSCDSLDERNWVVDFGGLKPLKAWLENTFDHQLNDMVSIIFFIFLLLNYPIMTNDIMLNGLFPAYYINDLMNLN